MGIPTSRNRRYHIGSYLCVINKGLINIGHNHMLLYSKRGCRVLFNITALVQMIRIFRRTRIIYIVFVRIRMQNFFCVAINETDNRINLAGFYPHKRLIVGSGHIESKCIQIIPFCIFISIYMDIYFRIIICIIDRYKRIHRILAL